MTEQPADVEVAREWWDFTSTADMLEVPGEEAHEAAIASLARLLADQRREWEGDENVTHCLVVARAAQRKLYAEVRRLRAQAEGLRAALLRHGTHDTEEHAERECRQWRDGPDTCDCGLDAALAEDE